MEILFFYFSGCRSIKISATKRHQSAVTKLFVIDIGGCHLFTFVQRI